MTTNNMGLRQTQQYFSFDTASDLLAFFEGKRQLIVGHCITAIFSQFFYTHSSDERMPFIILDTLALGVNFYDESGVEIVTADFEDFQEDGSPNEDGEQPLVFISKLPEIDNPHYLSFNPSCPITRPKILDIIVDRHSDEIKNEYGDVREKGGDYFSSIRFVLEGGFELMTRYDGWEYTYIGYSQLPKTYLQKALAAIPFEYDSLHKIRAIVDVTKITPDELAQEAINVIKRCAKAGYWTRDIAELLRNFYQYGMNPDYVSNDGDTILSVIPVLGPKSVYTMRDYLELLK